MCAQVRASPPPLQRALLGWLIATLALLDGHHLLLDMWGHAAGHVGTCCLTCGDMLLDMWGHAAGHVGTCFWTCGDMLLDMLEHAAGHDAD